MLKARRREAEQLRFPEPREGLPEDPRPFFGVAHLAAASAVQEHLSSRCLVAVVGRRGAGKSTVVRKAANSRWARQWFLRDENGQPAHRRFWVDLEDCPPGKPCGEKVARALARQTFPEAVARISAGPCLLVLDNADSAFDFFPEGEIDETLAALVGCAERGASIVVTRGRVSDLSIDRPWTEVVEVTGYGSDDDAAEAFGTRAARHRDDPRLGEVVAACDRLPLAVTLASGVAADDDLEVVLAHPAGAVAGSTGLEFAVSLAQALLDADDRLAWGALSLLPSGLSEPDVGAVLASIDGARERLIHLHSLGVVQRGEAGVRVPASLRVPPESAGLTTATVGALWDAYVSRGRAIVGSVPSRQALDAGAGSESADPAPVGAAGERGRSGRGDHSRRGATEKRPDARRGDAWLSRQVATLEALARRPSLPEETFEMACAGLLIHRSGPQADAVDHTLLRLVELSLVPSSVLEDEVPASGTPPAARAVASGTPPAARAVASGTPPAARVAAATGIAGALEDQRRFETSVLVAQTLVDALRHGDHDRYLAEALCQLGRTERFCTQYREAGEHLDEALRLFDALDDGVGQGSTLFELGLVDLELGRLDGAEAQLTEALEKFAANDRPLGEANASLDLVRIDLARGRLDQAERRLVDAIALYQRAGDALGYANASLQLGQVALARGRVDGAERQFTNALDGYEQAADKVGFAHACLQLGQVELARGRLDSAERRFGGALAGYELVGDPLGAANVSLQLGQIDLARGRRRPAEQRLQHALSGYEQLGDRIGVANATLQLSQVALGLGDAADAEQKVRAAQYAYDQIGDVLGSANSRQVRAVVCQVLGQTLDAMALFGEAARLYDSIGRTANAGWSLAGAARTCTGRAERMGYAADAVRHLRNAGLSQAAAQLETELAEPEPVAEPAAQLPPEPEPEPAPDADVRSSPWPRTDQPGGEVHLGGADRGEASTAPEGEQGPAVPADAAPADEVAAVVDVERADVEGVEAEADVEGVEAEIAVERADGEGAAEVEGVEAETAEVDPGTGMVVADADAEVEAEAPEVGKDAVVAEAGVDDEAPEVEVAQEPELEEPELEEPELEEPELEEPEFEVRSTPVESAGLAEPADAVDVPDLLALESAEEQPESTPGTGDGRSERPTFLQRLRRRHRKDS